ncbi:MAG: adenosylcobinamide amidohydrolase [Ignisphaera sp.]
MKILTRDKDTFAIDLEREYVAISTAGCPKIYSEIRYIVFRRVPKDFEYVDLDSYCRDIASSIGIDYSKSSIFLTAVDVSSCSHGFSIYRNIKAEAFVTLGIDTPSCIGTEGPKNSRGIGTINVAVVVDTPLNNIGLLDLFRTVSEVKGMVMGLGGPMCISSPSIGTASDATLVAAPAGDERFAGISTDVGIASSMAVICALARHIRNISREEYIAKTLGFDRIDNIIDIAKEVYTKARIPHLADNEIEKEVREEMGRVLRDPNILLFIKGMRMLEAALSINILPGVNIHEYKSDSPGIIVDELVGKALAEYINGFKGLLMYYWIERLKERGETPVLKLLPPIADDIVAALIGGILSKIYDKYSR